MDSERLLDALDDYEDSLDHLSTLLQPLLDEPYSTTLKKLPLLDRAKLNITLVYALETLLFNYLKTSSTDPTTHPIMKELQRTKTYFAKVKTAEESMTSRPAVSLNKQAAQRVIQHSLGGGMTREEHEAARRALEEKIAKSRAELERKEREARERVLRRTAASTVVNPDVSMREAGAEGSEDGEIEGG